MEERGGGVYVMSCHGVPPPPNLFDFSSFIEKKKSLLIFTLGVLM